MVDGPSTAPHISELLRRIDRLENEMRTSLARIEARLDARVMSVDVYQAEKLAMQIQQGNTDRRVASLEDARQAMFRMMMGAFIGVITNTVGILIVYAITKQ